MSYSRCIVRVLLLVATSVGGTAIADAEVRYRVTKVERGFIRCRIPFGLNNHGDVCGSHYPGNMELGYLWPASLQSVVPIPNVPGCTIATYPRAINDAGHVAGFDQLATCSAAVATSWSQADGIRQLGWLSPDFPSSGARAINNLNQIVGRSRTSTSTDPAFLWDESTGMISLGDVAGGGYASEPYDINDSTWIIGETRGDGFGAYLWTAETGAIPLATLFPDDYGVGRTVAINNNGDIVGTASSPDGLPCPYIWNLAGSLTCLRPILPEMTDCAPTALNDRAEVIGGCTLFSEPWTTWVWDARRGMRNLSLILDPCQYDLNELGFYPPVAINNRGQILVEPIVNMDSERVARLLTPYVPGDVDADDDVDLHDLTQLLSNFGTPTGAALADGDVEGCDDEDVDLDDLILLLGNFGESYP